MKRTMILTVCAIALAGGVQAGLPTAGETGQAAIASNVAVIGVPDWLRPTDMFTRRGADDPAGDDHGRRHGGHGADDGAGHTMNVPAGPELLLFARNGADDGAGDDHGGRGGHGGGHGADDGADDGASGSGRSKPRVPGGSGCDDPGDVQEHAGCSG